MGSSFALWQLPLVYLAGFILACLSPARAWRLAGISAIAGILGSLAGLALMLRGGAAAASVLPAALIALLAWVIIRFSRDYLRGEPGQPRFVAALLFTLAAVATVVVTDHLGVMLVAWTATSLGLHRLLLFYPGRVAAQVAAHKKFIASRLAEFCLLSAVVLIYRSLDTFSISALTLTLDGATALTPALDLAAVLIAIAVLLKCAQLPLHGWLIQVMEAPTPVSALLHAGIVNLGGFVVIRLAALFSASPSAQALLVIVGGLTALLAGCAMLTRISIKLRLAWSTCAQMGFMLMECGLGLYDLAMLHLLAHSLYKAHAFLCAGAAVYRARSDDLLPAGAGPGGWVKPLVNAGLALLLVQALVLLYGILPVATPVAGVASLILGLGIAPLLGALWRPQARLFTACLRPAGVVCLYLLWHTLFSRLVGVHQSPVPLLALFTSLVFVGFYLGQVWIASDPCSALAGRLQAFAFAGFYLDEKFTRLAFRLWPVSLRRPAGPASRLSLEISPGAAL